MHPQPLIHAVVQETMILASTCVGCEPNGGPCALTRHGCLPQCATNADCAGTGLTECDPTTHVCGVSCAPEPDASL